MKINAKITAILIITIFVSLITLSSILGFWETENIRTPNNNTASESSHDDDDEDNHEEEVKVKGITTYNDLLSYGLNETTINKILGSEVSNKDAIIKDICIDLGLSYGSIKEQLTILLEELPKP